MKQINKIIASVMALSLVCGLTACGNSEDDGHGYLLDNATTTTAFTVEVNTETLASEQEEQVANLADTLTGELENKTIKWMSFYDPWHPTGQGNSKPVSVELFEKNTAAKLNTIRQHGQISMTTFPQIFSAVRVSTSSLLLKLFQNAFSAV